MWLLIVGDTLPYRFGFLSRIARQGPKSCGAHELGERSTRLAMSSPCAVRTLRVFVRYQGVVHVPRGFSCALPMRKRALRGIPCVPPMRKRTLGAIPCVCRPKLHAIGRSAWNPGAKSAHNTRFRARAGLRCAHFARFRAFRGLCRTKEGEVCGAMVRKPRTTRFFLRKPAPTRTLRVILCVEFLKTHEIGGSVRLCKGEAPKLQRRSAHLVEKACATEAAP